VMVREAGVRNASAKTRRARSALPRPHGRSLFFGQKMARKWRPEAFPTALSFHTKTPGSLLQPGVSLVVASTKLLTGQRGPGGTGRSSCWPGDEIIAARASANVTPSTKRQIVHNLSTETKRPCQRDCRPP
jgi:hypothetical protein